MSTETAEFKAFVAGYKTDSAAVEHLTEVIRIDGLQHAFGMHVAELWQASAAEMPGMSGGDVVSAVAELTAASLSGTQRLQLAQLLIASVAVSGEVSAAPPDVAWMPARLFGESSAPPDLAGARESILDSLEVLDSKSVARILAPTSAATRSVAQKRRKAGELIGLPIGTRPNYRYPAFQFDLERHKIRDVVSHANLRLLVEQDPYGAASWWLTPTELLDGNSPLEDLEAGELTVIAVDNVLDYSRRGM